MESDAVNDVKGSDSGEPSFVIVATCTGTNLEGNPVTLVDRMCMNEPAIDLVIGNMDIREQEAKAFRAEVRACKFANEGLESDLWVWQTASAVLACVFVFMIWAFTRIFK